jgi:hypothetical protein
MISNGVVNLSSEKRRLCAEVASVLYPGGRLALADIAAAGLEVELVQHNSAYRFTSERARRTSEKYGALSISLLALKRHT